MHALILDRIKAKIDDLRESKTVQLENADPATLTTEEIRAQGILEVCLRVEIPGSPLYSPDMAQGMRIWLRNERRRLGGYASNGQLIPLVPFELAVHQGRIQGVRKILQFTVEESMKEREYKQLQTNLYEKSHDEWQDEDEKPVPTDPLTFKKQLGALTEELNEWGDVEDFSYDDSRDAEEFGSELNPDDDDEDDNENRSQGRMGDEE